MSTCTCASFLLVFHHVSVLHSTSYSRPKPRKCPTGWSRTLTIPQSRLDKHQGTGIEVCWRRRNSLFDQLNYSNWSCLISFSIQWLCNSASKMCFMLLHEVNVHTSSHDDLKPDVHLILSPTDLVVTFSDMRSNAVTVTGSWAAQSSAGSGQRGASFCRPTNS